MLTSSSRLNWAGWLCNHLAWSHKTKYRHNPVRTNRNSIQDLWNTVVSPLLLVWWGYSQHNQNIHHNKPSYIIFRMLNNNCSTYSDQQMVKIQNKCLGQQGVTKQEGVSGATSTGGSINVLNENTDFLHSNIIFNRVTNVTTCPRHQKTLLHHWLNLLCCHMNFKGLIARLKFYMNTIPSSSLEQYFLVKCKTTD